MQASLKVLAFGSCFALAALGSVAANAQNSYSEGVYQGAVSAAHASGTEAVGQSTAAPAMNSSVSDDEVYKGAVAAARPEGTEAVGQSTGAPMMSSSLSRDEVYKGAVAAAHASGTEVTGQSTGMAAVTGGMPH